MRGTTWELGRHRLMCGDATSRDDMAGLMGFDRAEMVFTDPPYGVDIGGKVEHGSNVAAANKSRVESGLINDDLDPKAMGKLWLRAFWLAANSSRPGAAYYIFTAGASDLYLEMLKAVEGAGWLLKHQIIWTKQSMVVGRCDYHYMHEPILYGWKEGTHRFRGGRTKKTVWKYDKPRRSNLHPTMKPIGLVAEAIRNSSLEDEIVLDPFGGSGTTLIACERLGRSCRMMELDPKYCETIVRRWENETNQKAICKPRQEK